MPAPADYSKSENTPVKHIRDNHEKNLAFVIHRNKNANVVVYAGKLQENGNLHPTDPLDVYWVMYENNGHPREELNMIERNSAYGVSVKPREGHPGEYEVTLTSLKDRIIILKVENGKVVAKGVINGQEGCTLERIFVYSTTSWGMPKVQHVEIHGVDAKGNAIMEKYIPK